MIIIIRRIIIRRIIRRRRIRRRIRIIIRITITNFYGRQPPFFKGLNKWLVHLSLSEMGKVEKVTFSVTGLGNQKIMPSQSEVVPHLHRRDEREGCEREREREKERREKNL